MLGSVCHVHRGPCDSNSRESPPPLTMNSAYRGRVLAHHDAVLQRLGQVALRRQLLPGEGLDPLLDVALNVGVALGAGLRSGDVSRECGGMLMVAMAGVFVSESAWRCRVIIAARGLRSCGRWRSQSSVGQAHLELELSVETEQLDAVAAKHGRIGGAVDDLGRRRLGLLSLRAEGKRRESGRGAHRGVVCGARARAGPSAAES